MVIGKTREKGLEPGFLRFPRYPLHDSSGGKKRESRGSDPGVLKRTHATGLKQVILFNRL